MAEEPVDRIRILHVDDEPDFAELTATFLERADHRYTVETATTASEGLTKLDSGGFDCVVSDYDMPDRTGIEFLESVSEEYPDLPFILFTGKGSEEVASEAISAGVTDYLQKESGTDQYTVLANRILNAVDHTKSRQRVRQSDRRLRELVDSLPHFLYVVDEDGHYQLVNETLASFHDSTVEGVEGSTVAELLGESLAEQFRADVEAVLESGRTRRFGTFEIPDPDGQTHVFEPQLRPYEFAETDKRAALGIAVDVTDRTTYERKLNQLQQRTRALMHSETKSETAAVATETADDVIGAPLSGVHLVNDRGDMLEPTAFIDYLTTVFDSPPAYERGAREGSRAAIVWDVFESGDPLRIDDTRQYDQLTESTPARSVIIHPIEGHGIFVISSDEPNAFTDTDESLVEILSTTLTAALDRVEQEQSHRDRERRLERLHDVTVDLMQAESQQEIAELVVREAEEILEFPIAMVRLYDPDEKGLVPVAANDKVREVLGERPLFTADDGSFNWEAFETGQPKLFDDISAYDNAFDVESPLQSLMILPLGEYGTLSAGTTEPASFDEADEFLAQILATATETTLERVDHLSALERQRDQLKRQNERLEEFSSVVSHDIRNPLMVLSGAVEMAAETGKQEYFDRSERAIERMETMVEDLLTLARQGETVDELQSVTLEALCLDCWHTVDTESAAVVVEDDVRFLADRDRISHLFENLFRNSVEHGSTGSEGPRPSGNRTQSGSSRPAADDSIEPSGTDVTVRVGSLEGGFYVEDDGCGIDSDVRDRIFESGVSTSADNTGFGLAIVRRIAEAHGWSISVTESADHGARFEFTDVETLQH